MHFYILHILLISFQVCWGPKRLTPEVWSTMWMISWVFYTLADRRVWGIACERVDMCWGLLIYGILRKPSRSRPLDVTRGPFSTRAQKNSQFTAQKCQSKIRPLLTGKNHPISWTLCDHFHPHSIQKSAQGFQRERCQSESRWFKWVYHWMACVYREIQIEKPSAVLRFQWIFVWIESLR